MISKKTFIFLFLFVILTNGNIKAETKIYFSPSMDCENLIINNILSTKKELKIIIYSLTNQNIANAIKEVFDKNVDVKIIADRRQSKIKSSLVQSLIDYGIPIRISKKVHIEHNKVSIIDKNQVITGSYNYTNNATYNNSENCLLITDNENKYYNRFNQLWKYYE